MLIIILTVTILLWIFKPLEKCKDLYEVKHLLVVDPIFDNIASTLANIASNYGAM